MATEAVNNDQQRIIARMAQCGSRRNAQCGKMDRLLGWAHTTPMDVCDGCYALRGDQEPDESAGGRQYREDHKRRVLGDIKQDIQKAHAHVILTILGKHAVDFGERQALMLKAAPALGPEMANEIASQACPDALPKVQALFAAMTPRQIELTKRPDIRWAGHRPLWEKIEKEIASGQREAEKWTTIQKAAKFAAAQISSVGGLRSVALPILNVRHISCFGRDLEGKVHKEACPSLRQTAKGLHFCGDCGCGESQIAMLDGDGFVKLMHPELTCPRLMPGFTNSEVLDEQRSSDGVPAGPPLTGGDLPAV